MDNSELANIILEARKAKGLSQKELGDLLGVSNKAVSKWEKGETMPKTSTIIKLSKILDIDVASILGYDTLSDETKLNALKMENDNLKEQLVGIKTKRKKGKILIAFIIFACVIVTGIIVLCMNGNGNNNKITDAGRENTKIVFSDEEFVPAGKFYNYVLSSNNYTASLNKYASYYSNDSKGEKVVVGCEVGTNVVSIKSKGKTYYYIKKGIEDLKLNVNTIDSVQLEEGATINTADTMYGSLDFWESDFDGAVQIELFSNFYNSQKEAVDKKQVERYLGNDGYGVSVFLKNGVDKANCLVYATVYLGEFFKDDKGNAYFYDYSSGSAYALGEELANYVYK